MRQGSFLLKEEGEGYLPSQRPRGGGASSSYPVDLRKRGKYYYTPQGKEKRKKFSTRMEREVNCFRALLGSRKKKPHLSTFVQGGGRASRILKGGGEDLVLLFPELRRAEEERSMLEACAGNGEKRKKGRSDKGSLNYDPNRKRRKNVSSSLLLGRGAKGKEGGSLPLSREEKGEKKKGPMQGCFCLSGYGISTFPSTRQE